MAIEVVGEEVEVAVVVDEAAIDAAVVEVADAVQARGIGDGQRFQQNRVNQGEDGGVRSDAERDGENDCGSEAGRFAELAQREFQIVHRAASGVWTGTYSNCEQARESGDSICAGDLSIRLKNGSIRDDASKVRRDA